MIHQPLSPDFINNIVPEIVSPLPCLSGHVRHILLFVYLKKKKKNLISFIGSLDKCHISVFSALISMAQQYICMLRMLDQDKIVRGTDHFTQKTKVVT